MMSKPLLNIILDQLRNVFFKLEQDEIDVGFSFLEVTLNINR